MQQYIGIVIRENGGDLSGRRNRQPPEETRLLVWWSTHQHVGSDRGIQTPEQRRYMAPVTTGQDLSQSVGLRHGGIHILLYCPPPAVERLRHVRSGMAERALVE